MRSSRTDICSAFIEGTRSPDGRLYKGHTGAARLAFETGCPIIPAAIIGSRELQKPGQVIPEQRQVQGDLRQAD